MDGSIWIGTGPEDEQDKPLPQTGQWEHGWNVDSLNNEIIAGIHNHLLERLQEMKQQGIVEVTINSRGFIMQPQWVLEQTESIAEHLGGIRVDELGGIMRVLNLEAVRRRPRNSVPHNIPHGSAPAGAHASKMLPRSVQMYPGTYHSSQRERYAGNAVQMPRSGMGPFLNSVLEPPDAAHHQGSPARTCGPSGWTEQAGRPFSRHSARSSVNQRQGAPGPMVQVQGVHPGNDTAGTANDLRGSGGSYRHKRDGRECVSRGGRGARGRRGGRGAKGSSTGRNSGKAKDQSP
ncbi:unnamed protein product [Ostreobium quekettii]|uniref:Uncharacterized protein n=1 Tax=Ostreobium quekettii TaxID=121088 RepID=A0A8S1JDQ8_9CHLO|nr:unnamed protein product [Ostreobium quekettii]